MSNSLFTIEPRPMGGIWIFDDESRNVYNEALVGGVPELINFVLAKKGIDGSDGFVLVFAAIPFPNHDICLEHVSGGVGCGDTYMHSDTGMTGWLCPCLLKYFPEAPEKIYAMAMPKKVEAN
jgi:hypothetical protein